MTKILIVLFLLIISPLAHSDETSTGGVNGAVGLGAGWIEADGLSYRWYLGRQYIQATFVGRVNKEQDPPEEFVDFSLSYGRYLVLSNPAEFFPFGLKWIAGGELERNTNPQNDFFDTDQSHSPNALHAGVGLGFDMGNPLRPGVLVSVGAVYTATFRSFSTFEFVRLGLLPTAGIHYNF